jgi:hypothetical protein
MRQLDSAKRDGCSSSRLKTRHPGTATLDRTMILFDDVIEVLTAPHQHVFSFRILAPQKPECLMTGRIAVQRNLARPPRQAGSQCFAEKRLCGCNASIGAKQKLHTMPARIKFARDRHGAWRSLVAHLLWEHDAPIPNGRYIITAINELRVVRFANELDCGPICGPSDGMIRYAIPCDALQRASRAISADAAPGGTSVINRRFCQNRACR